VAISRRLLDDDESVLVSTRTHVKALIAPLLVLMLIAAVALVAIAFTGAAGRAQPLLLAVVWAVAFGLIALWVLKPFLLWLTTSYTVTTRRLITRSGVLTRRGHDIPLIRISDVSYEHGLVDRLLGCGTLVVSDASEQGRVELHDIPHVERVHLTISDQIFDNSDTRRTAHPDRHRTDDGS
jgi:membrane protein YdbS with pleckstrin-like domain